MNIRPQTRAEAVARQARLIEVLDEVATGLGAYALTRVTAASKLQAALTLRHRVQRLQQPPPTIHERRGFGYGAVLERIAFDFAGAGPIQEHIALLADIVTELKAELPSFLSTHQFNSTH